MENKVQRKLKIMEMRRWGSSKRRQCEMLKKKQDANRKKVQKKEEGV